MDRADDAHRRAERDKAAQLLEQALQRDWPGLCCRWLASTASTNSLLVEQARSPVFEPTLLVTDDQTAGRGRLDRRWQSAPGSSLTFSLALPVVRLDWSGLSLAVGVAIAEALRPAVPASGTPSLMLKWPNDLWLVDAQGGGRKLGGILIEGVARANLPRVAVIGMGLNVLPGTSDGLNSGYASVSEVWDPEAGAPSPSSVLERVAPAVLSAVSAFGVGGLAGFASRFARLDLLAGRAVQARAAAGDAAPIVGVADGIDDSGALRVRTELGLRIVVSGDLSVRLDESSGVAGDGHEVRRAGDGEQGAGNGRAGAPADAWRLRSSSGGGD